MRLPNTHRDSISFDTVMTPMIDVVFQLLIFFICTSSYATIEEMLPSRFAAASGAAAVIVDPKELDLERIALRARRSGGTTIWSLQDRDLGGAAEVRSQMAAVRRQMESVDTDAATLAVVLDLDGAVPLGDGIDVYDVCRLEGFSRIQFAAKAKPGDSTP